MQSSTIAGVAFFGLLVALAGLPSTFDPIAAVIVLGSAGALATTVTFLLRAGAVVTPLPPIVHGLAYFPGAWSATTDGTVWSGIFVHQDAVRDGLVLMTVFTCVASLMAHALASTGPARRFGRVLVVLAAPGGERAFQTALFIVFGVLVMLAYRSNTISLYIGGEPPAGSDESLGAQTQYPSFVALFFVHCAMQVFFALQRRPRASAVQLAVWVSATGLGGLLLFVLQSRRVMIGCFLLVLTLVHQILRAKGAQRLTRALLPAAGVGVALLAGAFFLSAYWRSSTQLGQAEDVTQRAGHAVEFAQDGDLSTTEIVSGHEQRLQYLGFEGACRQIFDQVALPWTALEGVERELALAIPKALNPDKRPGNEVYRCGTALRLLGLGEDVPCSATCNGSIIEGTKGVLVAGVLWVLALAVGEVIPATVVGASLIALPAIALVQIETGFAPLFGILRNLAFFMLVIAPGGILVNLARPRYRAEEPAGRPIRP